MKKHTKAYERLLARTTPRKVVDVATLRATAKRLRNLRHEEHYDQSRWICRTTCGTVACIAGHICLVKGLTSAEIHYIAYEGAYDIASLLANELGIPEEVCAELFNSANRYWPEPYKSDFDKAVFNYRNWQGRVQIGPYRGKRPSRVAADMLDAIADKKVWYDLDGFIGEEL